MKKIAIVGSGAYASYAASVINEVHPEYEVHIFEVGDDTIRSQDEIGYTSELLNCSYDALTKGRYFGFGGATAKWGGQILSFSDKDFQNPSNYLKEIVELNKKYRKNIFRKVRIKNDDPEVRLKNGMFTKTGVWLDYFHRNLFKLFGVKDYKNVTLHPLCRVTKVNADGKKIKNFEYIHKGEKKIADGFDYIFLAAGAFEDTRIMMMSGLQDKTCVQFSDHIAKRIFNIKGTTKIGSIDMEFKIRNFSFITKRIIGECEGVSYFGYPAYNADYPFFQNLKKLLFGHKFSMGIVWAVLKDMPSAFMFAWRFFVQHRLYVYKKEWGFVLHMENPLGHGIVKLSDTLDKFGEPGVAIDFSISPKSEQIFSEVTKRFDKLLTENGVEHSPVEDAVHTRKFEDEYHPFALYSDFDSVNSYFNQFDNMLVIHSGVLPRAGGINSTSAAFPLLEEFIRTRL